MLVDARARPPIPAFLGDRTYTNLERTLGNVVARGWTPTDSMRNADLDQYLAENTRAGIVHAGIPARASNRWWGGKGNEPVFAASEERADLFFPYAAVDPLLPGAAGSIASLQARGARGIVLEPGICDEPTYVDDTRLGEVYEACAAAGIPALVMGGGETGPDLSFSDPSRIDRVAVRHPDLSIVNVHGGWPFVTEALGVSFRRPNVWMLPDVYFPGLPGEADYILAASTFLQDRFLFATGYPFCPVQETVDRYLAMGFTDSVLEKILHANAARLFHLTPPKGAP